MNKTNNINDILIKQNNQIFKNFCRIIFNTTEKEMSGLANTKKIKELLKLKSRKKIKIKKYKKKPNLINI